VEQAQSSAPVRAQAQIDIAATDREVWTVLADIASWPTWNPAIRGAVCDEDLEVGTRFRFATEIGSLKCRVTRVDAPRSLAWQGRVLVLWERQAWQLVPGPDGTRVSVQAEMTGLVARLLRRRLTDRLEAVLDAVLQLLRLEAEVRVQDEREVAARAAEIERRARAHD
jgi:carbon monoxide dehydrogenase subunit G